MTVRRASSTAEQPGHLPHRLTQFAYAVIIAPFGGPTEVLTIADGSCNHRMSSFETSM
jgi:hypothetical protein